MRSIKKFLLAVVLTLAVAVLLSVCAFAAYSDNTAFPQGVSSADTTGKYIPSGYADVDDDPDWYLIGDKTEDFSTTATTLPTFAFIENGRFYLNKKTNNAVWVVIGNNMSGNSGEDAVVDASSPNSAYQKKFYAFAAAFVDVTNSEGNDFEKNLGEGVSADTVYSFGVSLKSADVYPIYNRWFNAGKASQQWGAKIHVTKAAYDAYLEYKAANTKMGTELEDDLVEYVYTNIARNRQGKNCLGDGATYRMAWIFANHTFNQVEIRGSVGATSITFGTAGLFTAFLECDTILLDSRIGTINYKEADRGLFRKNSALRTLAHVTYSAETDEKGRCSGKYEGSVAKNTVDLSGFAKVVINSGYATRDLLEASGIVNVVYFNSLMNGEEQWAGTVDYQAFASCVNLEKITLTAPLTKIGQSAFSGCTALTTVNLKGGVASGLTIGTDAFKGVTSVKFVVYDLASKTALESALQAAGYDFEVIFSSPLKNPIIAEGFTMRIHEYSGLRSIFTFDVSVAAQNVGYTLSDYGVITFAESTYTAYENDVMAILADALAGENSNKIILSSIRVENRFIEVFDEGEKASDQMYADEVGDKTFCVSLVGIQQKDVRKGVYSVAYTAWTNDATGAVDYTITIYESSRIEGKQAFSLYDVTAYAFANGIVNTETVTDENGNVWQCCLWDVLSCGAVAYEGNASGSAKCPEENWANPSHYLNIPLLADVKYTGFYADGGTLEATSSTNVAWSIIENDDGTYIGVYRNAGGEGAALLPPLTYPGKTGGVSAPFRHQYDREDANAPAISYNPSQKITTVVIDYGVDGVMVGGDGALSGLAFTKTIVYPNGFDEIAHNKRDWKKVGDYYVADSDGDGELYDGGDDDCVTYLFARNMVLTDVIWANNDQYAHMEDFTYAEGDTKMEHLFDLRGMGHYSANKYIFEQVPLIENIVFGKESLRPRYIAFLKDISNIQRVWHAPDYVVGEKSQAPLAKTIDLSYQTKWGDVQAECFNVKSDGYTIILYSGNCTTNINKISSATFFGGSNAANLKVKIVIADKSGNPVDPAAYITALTGQIQDTSVTDRIFIYRVETGKFVNPSGTEFQ